MTARLRAVGGKKPVYSEALTATRQRPTDAFRQARRVRTSLLTHPDNNGIPLRKLGSRHSHSLLAEQIASTLRAVSFSGQNVYCLRRGSRGFLELPSCRR